jgi:hypothetical protein
VSSVGYGVDTSALVALTANTPRTALMVITPAQFGAVLTSMFISFNGTTASEKPCYWEIVRSTNASNSTPGTNNTNENSNIRQLRGQTITAGFTAFSASTAGNEPTVLTRLASNELTVVGGSMGLHIPLGREYECGVSAGLGVRLTTPAAAAAVSARVELEFERI